MAAELKIMSARAVKGAVSALGEEFSRASGCALAFEFAPVGTLEKKLAAGEYADVVILSRSAIADMEALGRLVSNSMRELGRTSIGVAVCKGAPIPDMTTPEAFKRLLLSARAIALSDPAIGGTAARYLPQLFARMAIAETLEGKLMRCKGGGGEVAERVARGEAEIGVTFISELLPFDGVAVVGPLPAPYGNDTTYCAAVCATSANPDAGRALIEALGDSAAEAVWLRAGFTR